MQQVIRKLLWLFGNQQSQGASSQLIQPLATRPVQYFSQPKAWMTGAVLQSVLRKLNRRLSAKSRKIVLFMDNAGCHIEDIKDTEL